MTIWCGQDCERIANKAWASEDIHALTRWCFNNGQYLL
jgi:hypothetical protein